MNKLKIKSIYLIFAVFTVGMFLSDASAQVNVGARSTYVPRKPSPYNPNPRNPVAEQAIDLTPQYEAIVNQKRDGNFLLYTDRDGTKVFLAVNAGHPGPVFVVDSRGQHLRITEKNSFGQCWRCTETRCYRIPCRKLSWNRNSAQ